MPCYENTTMVKLLADPDYDMFKDLSSLFEELRPAEFAITRTNETASRKMTPFYNVDRKAFQKHLLSAKDSHNRDSLFYAMLQKSRRMSRALQDAGVKALASISSAAQVYEKKCAQERKEAREKELEVLYGDLLTTTVDVKNDQRARMKEFLCDEDDDESLKEAPEVSTKCTQYGKGKVVQCIPEDGKGYYNLYMTATEAGMGMYGMHSFYVMQLVYNPTTDITFLFNQWGRIGEDGSYQSSPYINRKEAIDEFKKIFKSKTKNEWADRSRDRFVQKAKWVPKYPKRRRKKKKGEKRSEDVKDNEEEGLVASLQDAMRFVPKRERKESKLPKIIRRLIRTMFDVAAVKQRQYGRKGVGMNENYFAFGELSYEDLDKAFELIKEIAVNVSAFEATQKQLWSVSRQISKIEKDQRDRETKVQRKERELESKKAQLTTKKEALEKQLQSLDKEGASDAKTTDATASAHSDFHMLTGGFEAAPAASAQTKEEMEAKVKEIDESLAKVEEGLAQVVTMKEENLQEEETEKEQITELRKEMDQLSAKRRSDEIVLQNMSNKFFTLLPIADFSRSSIMPITTGQMVNKYIWKVNNLVQMQVAIGALMGAAYRSREINPIDYCFLALNMPFQPLDTTNPEYVQILNYARKSYSNANEKNFTVFRIERKGEDERYGKYQGLENKMLLWHGSSVANFAGILTQGLRIAPPEADISGCMFGRGIYFADAFQKSTHYAGHGKGIQLLLLCEVALGKMFEAMKTDWTLEKAPEGFDSTKGMGQQGPDFEHIRYYPDGVGLPDSHSITYPKRKDKEGKDVHYPVGYNEYIVYDEAQVKMRYLIMLGDFDDEKDGN